MKWFHLHDGLPSWLLDTDHLMRFEGRAASAYFEAWRGLPIKWKQADRKIIPPHWTVVTERTSLLSHNHGGRRAVNPCHAILNYAYALLEHSCRLALQKYGFDVACGFLHADKVHRDGLVYDLMETARAKVDDAVLRLLATTTLKRGDIIKVEDGSCRLSPQSARFIVASCTLPQADIDKSALWLKALLLHSAE